MHPTEKYELERLIGGPIPRETDRLYVLYRAAMDRVRAGGTFPVEVLLVIAGQSGALREPTKKPVVLEGTPLGAYLSVRNDFDKGEKFQGTLMARGEGLSYGMVQVAYFGDRDNPMWVPADKAIVLHDTPIWAKPQPLPLPVEGAEVFKDEDDDVPDTEVEPEEKQPAPTERFKATKEGTRFVVAKPGEATWTGPFRGIASDREIFVERKIEGKGKRTKLEKVAVFIGDAMPDDDLPEESSKQELVEA